MKYIRQVGSKYVVIDEEPDGEYTSREFDTYVQADNYARGYSSQVIGER